MMEEYTAASERREEGIEHRCSGKREVPESPQRILEKIQRKHDRLVRHEDVRRIVTNIQLGK